MRRARLRVIARHGRPCFIQMLTGTVSHLSCSRRATSNDHARLMRAVSLFVLFVRSRDRASAHDHCKLDGDGVPFVLFANPDGSPGAASLAVLVASAALREVAAGLFHLVSRIRTDCLGPTCWRFFRSGDRAAARGSKGVRRPRSTTRRVARKPQLIAPRRSPAKHNKTNETPSPVKLL